MINPKHSRIILGLTQSQMADACNTHIGTIRKWDRDSGQSPAGPSLRLIKVYLVLHRMGMLERVLDMVNRLDQD